MTRLLLIVSCAITININTFGQVPDQYRKLGDFNSNGICVIQKKVWFVSIKAGGDTVYHTSCFPELYLSEYRIIGKRDVYSYESHLVSNEKDTLDFLLSPFTWEEFWDWKPDEESTRGYNLSGDCTGYFSRKNDSNYTKFHSFEHLGISLEGLMDTNGVIIQPVIYTKIADFGKSFFLGQPLYPFVFKNKVGFMNDSGTIVIPPIYDNVLENFYNNSDWYHNEGDAVESYHFIENRCEVVYNSQLGIIDNKGNIILPFIYKHIWYEYNFADNKHTLNAFIATDWNGVLHRFDVYGNEF